MKIICVDDEALILQLTLSMVKDLPETDEALGFNSATEALEYLEDNNADIALLDIDMPDMDGLTLAMRIKELRPDTQIIFLTGYAQYALDAFQLHASGYLMKPTSKDKLEQEIRHALAARSSSTESTAHISAKTFGNFDLFVDGKAVVFSRSKAKELMAYLVDRQGSSVTRAEAFAVLWEDEFYDRAMQKQMDVVVRALRQTLKDYGISELLEMQSGGLRSRSEILDCDLYHFFAGDIAAVNSYRGEYMSSYSWASLTEAYMDRLQRKRLE